MSSVVSDPSGEKPPSDDKNRADTSSESVDNDTADLKPTSYDLWGENGTNTVPFNLKTQLALAWKIEMCQMAPISLYAQHGKTNSWILYFYQ